MNKTLRMILSIKKVKKVKPTYLNWKTFNAKQTWIHIPKVLHILKKIAAVLKNSCKYQIKMHQQLIQLIAQKIATLDTTNKINNTLESKQIAFATIFNVKKKKETSMSTELNITDTKKIDISTQYIIHVLLLNMYHNIKDTKINTVTLPRKRTQYTILKSPHADKKAREQFMKELYNVRISMQHHVAFMQYMNSIVLAYTKAFVHGYKYDAFYENKI